MAALPGLCGVVSVESIGYFFDTDTDTDTDWFPAMSGNRTAKQTGTVLDKRRDVMYYTRFDTRFCEIILAGDERGLCHLHLNTGEGSRQFEISPAWKKEPAFFTDARDQILEYLNGSRHAFDVVLNPGGTDFQKKVWKQLRKIPYGSLVSYGEVAKDLGLENGARAVGGANGKNPLPLIIPCHRVVGADGSLAGFAHGTAIKKQLIELEKANHVCSHI